jgi:PGF-pre-PGF domain-containing protein
MLLSKPTPSTSIVRIATLIVLLAVVFAPITSVLPASVSVATATPAGNTGPGTTGLGTPPANTADPKTHPKVGSLLGHSSADSDSGLSTASTSGSTSDIHVAVEIKKGATGEVASLIAQYGSIEAQIEGRITATIPESKLTDLANGSVVRRVERPKTGQLADTSNTGGEDEINADDLHQYSDSDFSGKGATVAVLDLQDFDTNNDIYSDQVVDRINTDHGPSDSHGTKTAEIVAETAPKANLILAKITSYTHLINTIEYLRTETETDVISISFNYANVGPLDGSSEVDEAIQQFADDGGIFVPSMGNQANGKHWYGTYNDPDNDQYIEVGDGTHLIDVNVIKSTGIFLQWDDYDTLSTSDEDYALQVINGDTGKIIRRSDNTQSGPGTSPPEEAVAVLSSDTNPKIRIKHNSGDTDAQLFLRSWSARFTPSSKKASGLLPAMGPDALSVGAYGPAGTDGAQSVEPFSSQGPTSDGRIKPDIVAPDGISINGDRSLQYGTSFAAPHAAGIATIAKAENPDLSPSTFKSETQDTAISVQDDEPNNAAGYGLINGTGILSRVETEQPTINSYTVTDNTDGDAIVAAGDEVQFEASVTDHFLDTVEVDASTYGMGTIELGDENTDGTYTATGTVGPNANPGASVTTLTVTDHASNSATATSSSVAVDGESDVTALSVTNAPLNPSINTISISGTAEAVAPVTFKLTDVEGESGIVTKEISSTDFSVEIDPASLSLTGGDGQLGGGTATLEAEQSDTFRRADQATTFEIDRTNPSISIDSPSDLSIKSGDTFDVTYTATDSSSIQSADISLVDQDGNTIATTTDTTVPNGKPTTTALRVPQETADGTYTIVITARDVADNTQTNTFDNRLTVDDKVQTLSAESTITNGQLTVTGRADASKQIQFTLTDSSGNTDTIHTTLRSNQYEITLGISDTLRDGRLTVAARQGSVDGEPEETLTDITLDRTAPTVAIESVSTPTDPAMVGQDISVEYTVTDANGYKTIGLNLLDDSGSLIKGSEVTPTDPTSGQTETAKLGIPETIADGTYDLALTATDHASNSNSNTVEDVVTVKKTQVTSLVSKRVPAVFNNTATVEMAGNIGSPTGIKYHVVQGDNTDTLSQSLSSSRFDSSIDLGSIGFSPSEGSLSINAKQATVDSAGNTNDGFANPEVTLSTAIDNTPPTVTVGNVDTMAVTSGETITTTYTSDDTNDHGLRGGVVKLVRERDGTVVTKQSVDSLTDKQQTETTLTVPNTENGDHTIRVVSNDTAYNTGAANSGTIAVANEVRETTVTNPASGVVGNTGTVTLAGNVDAIGDISFQLTDGADTATTTQTISSTDYSTTVDLSTLSPSGGDGVFATEDTVTINSDYGSSYKTADSSATVTIDNTAPTASILSPSATTVKQGESVDVSFKLIDAGQASPESATVQLSTGGTTLTSTTVQDISEDESVTATLSIPADATATSYDIVIGATDTAGNTDPQAGTKSGAVTVESTAIETEPNDDGGSGGGGSGGSGGGGSGGSGGGGGSIPAPQPDPATPEDTEPTEETESDVEPSETPNTDSNNGANGTDELTNTIQQPDTARSVTGDVEIIQRNKSTVESVVTFGTGNNSTAAGVSQSDSQTNTDVLGQGNRPVLLSSTAQERSSLDQERRVPRRVRTEITANAESADGSIVAETLTIDATTAKQRYTASISATETIPHASETDDRRNTTTATDTESVNTAIKHGETPSEKTIGAIEVGHSISNDEVDTASFTVGVSQSKLIQQNMSTDDVTLYRYHGGDWTRLQTHYLGSNGTTERFTAISPGLSVFVIGATNGSSEAIDSTDINQTQAFENDNVAINATVENTGTDKQVYTVTFDVGGKTTNRSVSVPGGETRTVTHVTTIGNNVGGVSKDVYINGMFAGTIEVASLSSVGVDNTQPPITDTSTQTRKPMPPETQTPTETLVSSGNPILILLIAFVAFAMAVVSVTLRDE